MSYMIGVDVGGTFTDFSVFDQETGELFNYKDSSTPADPSKAIVKGVQDVLEIKKAKPESTEWNTGKRCKKADKTSENSKVCAHN